jgi:hypothetical protein
MFTNRCITIAVIAYSQTTLISTIDELFGGLEMEPLSRSELGLPLTEEPWSKASSALLEVDSHDNPISGLDSDMDLGLQEIPLSWLEAESSNEIGEAIAVPNHIKCNFAGKCLTLYIGCLYCSLIVDVVIIIINFNSD